MEGKGRADQSEISCGGKGEAGRPLNSERVSEGEHFLGASSSSSLSWDNGKKSHSFLNPLFLSSLSVSVGRSHSGPADGGNAVSRSFIPVALKSRSIAEIFGRCETAGLHDQNGSLALSLGRREAAAVLLKDRVEIRAPMHASQFTHTENVLERRCQKSSTIVIIR